MVPLSTTPDSDITQPNVVLIMLDDMDIQDISAFGITDTYTPTIDSLSQGGMVFTNFYAPAAVCSPSRVGLLTSRFPLELGFTRAVTEASPHIRSENDNIRFKGGIPQEVITIGEILSPTYQTAHFGKWHIGLWQDQFAPPAKGFDESHVLKGTYFNNNILKNNNSVERNVTEYRPTLITSKVISYIENRDHSKPFFTNIWYTIPHTPLHIPPNYQNTPGFDLTTPRGKLSSMLHHVDGQIKRIVDILEEEGIADNTLILLTSDNGGLVTPTKREERRYRGFKHSLFDGGIHVPFLAYFPSQISASSVNANLTSMFDIFPTLVDFAELEIPQDIVGKSLRNTMLTGEEFQGNPLQWAKTDHWIPDRIDESSYTSYAYREGHLKAIKSATHTRASLYELENDPYETTNIRSQNPRIFRELDNKFHNTKAALTRIPMSVIDSTNGNAQQNPDMTFSFSGPDDEVYLGPSAYHEFSGTSGSIDFTLLMQELPITISTILAKNGSYEFSISENGNLNVTLFGYDAIAQTKEISLSSDQLIADESYRITLTSLFHKNSYNSYRLYVNQKLVDEIRDLDSLYALGTDSDNMIRLGSRTSGYFNGTISHPEIYKTFFNDEEVAALE